MTFGLTMKSTRMFFDRKAVRDATTRAERKVLSKAGAFIRTRARTSIKRRKKSATPGNPPHAHSKDKVATLKNILFAYDPQNHSVVIGPVKLNGKRGHVPRLLEQGGRASFTNAKRRRGGVVKTTVTGNYRAFPYMGPAKDAELPKFPSLWRNSITPAAGAVA